MRLVVTLFTLIVAAYCLITSQTSLAGTAPLTNCRNVWEAVHLPAVDVQGVPGRRDIEEEFEHPRSFWVLVVGPGTREDDLVGMAGQVLAASDGESKG